MPAALRPRHGEAWDDRKKKKKKKRSAEEDWEAAFQEFMAADDDDDDELFSRKSLVVKSKGEIDAGAAMAMPSSRPTAEPAVAAEPEMPRRRRPRRSYQYHGIRQRPWGRWSSEIRDPIKGVRLWLGTFDTAVEAAHAYDAEARRIHGRKARTNFPQADPAAEPALAPVPAIYHHGTTHRLDAPPLCFLLGDDLVTFGGAPTDDSSAATSSEVSGEEVGDGAGILLECCSDDVMDNLLADFDVSSSDMDKDIWSLLHLC